VQFPKHRKRVLFTVSNPPSTSTYPLPFHSILLNPALPVKLEPHNKKGRENNYHNAPNMLYRIHRTDNALTKKERKKERKKGRKKSKK